MHLVRLREHLDQHDLVVALGARHAPGDQTQSVDRWLAILRNRDHLGLSGLIEGLEGYTREPAHARIDTSDVRQVLETAGQAERSALELCKYVAEALGAVVVVAGTN